VTGVEGADRLPPEKIPEARRGERRLLGRSRGGGEVKNIVMWFKRAFKVFWRDIWIWDCSFVVKWSFWVEEVNCR
jgi:hypothetical protein